MKKAFFFSLFSILVLTNSIFSQILNNDVEVTKINCLGTCLLRHSQSIEVIIKNNGLATQSNIAVSLSVTGSNLFSNTQTVVILPYNATTAVVFNSFTPLSLGSNSIYASVPADQDTTNNYSKTKQDVGCFIVSKTTQIQDTSFKRSACGNYYFAFKYTAPIQSTSISAVGCVVPSILIAHNLGKQISPILYNVNSQQFFIGDTITIQNKHLDTLSYFNFKQPIQLISNNDYLIGIAPLTQSFFPIGLTTSPIYTNITNYYYSGYIGFPLGSPYTYSVNGYLSLNGKFINANNTLTLTSLGWYCRRSTTPTLIVANGCQTYTWSTGSTHDTTYVAPYNTSTYSVAGTTSLGCIAEKTISIKVYIDCFLDITKNLNESPNIEIHPNPCKGSINVMNLNTPMCNYFIEDMSGRVIKTGILQVNNSIDVGDLDKSVYLIKFYKNELFLGSSKLIKID